MILVDTNIVIDAVRLKQTALFDAFAKFDAAVCGVVRAEILHGAKSSRDQQRYSAALGSFSVLPITEPVWDVVGDVLRRTDRAGIPLSFPDAIIIAVSIMHHVPLWTRDNAMRRATSAISELELFDESSLNS